MNSRSKPTGPRKGGTRARKPATIDLEAKELGDEAAKKTGSAEASTAAGKTETTSKTLGREGAKQSAAKSSSDTKKDEAPKASKPAEKSTSVPPAAPAEKSGGGFFSGLVGAAAAVVGLGAVGQYDGAKDIPFIGSLYSGGTEQVAGADSTNEIADLRQQIEALKSSAAPVDLAPINERLAQIEAAGTSGGLDEASANRLAEVEAGLGEVTQTLSSIAESAAEGTGASSEAIAAAIGTVTQRLETLENSVGELSQATSGPSQETIAKLAEIEAKVSELASASGVDLSPVENRIGEIETSIASLKESIGANTQSVDNLNAQSSSLQETVNSVKASEKVARSVAVNALGAALENDNPISLAIASIESLGGKSQETERLAELSRAGVPTQNSLLSELAAFTDKIQNPVADTSSGSISERFWANAKNLVTFRSTGPQEGTTAIAVLSRVKANLENGNLEGVISEWGQLPPEVQTSGADWIAKVNTRQEAFSLYNSLSDNLSAQAG